MPDERLGEAVTLVVAPQARRRGRRPRRSSTFVKGQLAGYKAPRHVVVVDEIRRSGSGKADYRWAKATAADALGVAS